MTKWKVTYKILILLISIVLLSFSCSTTKNIPDGKYLLDQVNVDKDNKDILNADIFPLIRQKPNDPKLMLNIYNWAGKDSSWINRMIRKIGNPPVIYDQSLTNQSVKEINIKLNGKGYLRNVVGFTTDTVGKKMKVTYHITGNEPYTIKTYDVDIDNVRIDSLMIRRSKRGRSLLKPGNILDTDKLEEERTKVSQSLRNRGYYGLTLDNFQYLADTTLQSNQVDLTLTLRDTSSTDLYSIRKVSVYSGYDPANRRGFRTIDSVMYKGIQIYYDSTHFLKPDVLEKNILVRSGNLYSETRSLRTYNYLSALGCVTRTNVQFSEAPGNDTSKLDCNIYITPGNIHEVQMGLDGTNKAGDLGIAANIGYTHHNIFNGAEALRIKLRGAYEFVKGNDDNEDSQDDVLTHNFYEFGIQAGLSFPKIHVPFIGSMVRQRYNVNTVYEASFDIQKRPEYTRDFFNLSWKNQWANDSKTLSQSLNVIDINYVMMPWVSADFEAYLNKQENSLTKYSYENVFTAGISYNVVYTNQNLGNARQKLYTVRFNAESSGNLLNSIFSLSNAKKSASGQYNILGNPFAQYVKGDISYTETIRLTQKNSFAWRSMIGAAYPYGNSNIMDTAGTGIKTGVLPFEKRYYSGGPNSVRGWNTRYLGPGSYNGDVSNPATHVGDLKMELNAEFRHKWINWLELAAFVDAGNIWTINNYENQPGGQFNVDKFYKEIAIGTGVGFRIDLSFLIIRIDMAKKVYDPAREEGKRWTLFKEGLAGNSGLYFAIGYPF